MDRVINRFNLACVAVFCLYFYIALHTPMHSDDFQYYNHAFDLRYFYEHYMGWTGRIPVHLFASSILQVNSHIVTAMFSAAMVLGLFLLIDKLVDSDKLKTTRLILCASLYWVANPDLGQTTFWIIGSANYLWPLVLGIYFLVKYIHLLNNENPAVMSLAFLSVLAFFCGWSTEGVSIAIMVAITLYVFFIKKTFPKQITTYVPLCLFLLGVGFLFFAPGNYVRASSAVEWQSLPLYAKIAKALLIRFPRNELRVIIALVALAVTFAIIIRNKKSFSGSEQAVYQLAILYFMVSCVIQMALAFAPFAPKRAFNTSLVFMLISNSYLLLLIKTPLQIKQLRGFAVVVLSYFAYSYYNVAIAYHWAYNQSLVREQLIRSHKNEGKLTVSIPDYNFMKLISRKEQYDGYHNSIEHGKYYGVNSVDAMPVDFNYGVLAESPDIKGKSISYFGREIKVDVYLSHEGKANKLIMTTPSGLEFAKINSDTRIKLSTSACDFNQEDASQYKRKLGDASLVVIGLDKSCNINLASMTIRLD